MKDPLQIKHWEKKLGRKLTVAEKNSDYPVTIGDNTFYLEIQELDFPYDLMDRNVLFQLNKKIGGG